MEAYKRNEESFRGKVNGPDGLEAWCVALSACFINFVMAGLGRMASILFVAVIELYQVDRQQASVPFTIRSSARNLLGPVVGIIGQKYGVRTTTLWGGGIATISTIACFYGSSILWMTILWGVMNGTGAALCMTLPQVILGQHFKKYRTTASGMAFSGGCVGSFLFPVLLEYLLNNYGMGGTFLIMSGLVMNIIPAAIVLKKPSWLKKKRKRNMEVSTVCKEADNESDSQVLKRTMKNNEKFRNDSKKSKEIKNGAELNNSEYSMSSANNLDIDIEYLRQKKELVINLFTEFFDNKRNCTDKICLYLYEKALSNEFERMYVIIDEILGSKSNIVKNSTTVPPHTISELKNNELQYASPKNEVMIACDNLSQDVARESMMLLLNKIITEDTNNILALLHESKHSDILKIINQFQKIHKLLEGTEECEFSPSLKKQNNIDDCMDKNEKVVKQSNTFFAHVKTAIRLHANPIFLLISLCRSVHFITFVPVMTVVVDFAMDKGLMEEDGKYVIAALSFGDLIGRLCLGWVTDKEYLDLPKYMLLVMVIQGACTASLSLMQSRTSLLLMLIIFGLLQGSLFIRHPVLVTKYLGKNEQSVAMGCCNFFSGLLGFAFPSYIGYFRDTIGSYDYIFYINGAIGTVIGLMWLFEPYFIKSIKSNEISGDSA